MALGSVGKYQSRTWFSFSRACVQVEETERERERAKWNKFSGFSILTIARVVHMIQKINSNIRECEIQGCPRNEAKKNRLVPVICRCLHGKKIFQKVEKSDSLRVSQFAKQ